MTEPHHDSAAFLAVEYTPGSIGRGGYGSSLGWYVLRTCACHRGEVVSVPFATRTEAERLRLVLDRDARWHAAIPGPAEILERGNGVEP